MTTPHPLEQAARTALAATAHRTTAFTHDGRRYVAKRLAAQPRRLLQTLFMRWLVKRVTGQPLPLRTLALSAAATSMDFEANRLQRLAAEGIRVPRLVFLGDGFFVLEHCGDVVATLLERWQADEWRPQLLALARELGAFHRAGQWHGGAQIKNLTLQDGVSTRIDFEENFGEFLPLPVTQATDLALFLNSISLAGPIDEAESRRLLPQLLGAYRTANPDPAIGAVIDRSLPLLATLTRVARPFRRFSRKGIRRVEILVAVLAGQRTQPD